MARHHHHYALKVATIFVAGCCLLKFSSACAPDPANVVEYCNEQFVRKSAVKVIQRFLEDNFYGQHVAMETVLPRLRSHLNNPNPGKALVLSFHGMAGAGKTFLAQSIRQGIFVKGETSRYTKFYQCSHVFRDRTKVNEYKDRLVQDVRDTLRLCGTALFIFDEVDMMPPKVLDALVGFMEWENLEPGLNQKNAIYIFLSNAGAGIINRLTQAAKKNQTRREDLDFEYFEYELMKEVYNSVDAEGRPTGLNGLRLVERNLIDFYVPFLPMERKHVILCIEAALSRHRYPRKYQIIQDVANSLQYEHEMFSTTGCKRIENLVLHKITMDREKTEF